MMNDEFSWHRRSFLRTSGFSLGSIACAALMQENQAVANQPLPKPHFPARTKHVIYLHMIGAPSQLDLFDHKPMLRKRHGEECPAELLKGRRFAFIGKENRLNGSPFTFKPRGQSEQWMSDLLPHLAEVADELSVVRTMHTDEINHAPAQMFLHTGFGRGGRPSLGSWLSYGLGTENNNLPAYIVLLSGPLGGAGTSLWNNGFLPSIYQGIQFRSQGDAVLFLSHPEKQSKIQRQQILKAVTELNKLKQAQVGDPEIETRIAQYEMAFKMQTSVPELMDLTKESQEVLKLYGVQPGKPSFAQNCLLARRLIESGVRIVELYDADWDHHNNIGKSLPNKAKQIDQAMAALIQDLKRRDLLKETLIIWGSEFGRTPIAQGQNGDGKKANDGRDHHKDAFTMWLAGGGIKPGISYGRTDEFGFSPIEDAVHVHDLNATVLHLMGLDHERLTYKYQGREFRLTDVHGTVLKKLLA